mgnify:CR=1 FL=1|tara:strand:- start:44930 stop:45031 length:102 start_codon:yes stop_codon:yes gene_type:complete
MIAEEGNVLAPFSMIIAIAILGLLVGAKALNNL